MTLTQRVTALETQVESLDSKYQEIKKDTHSILMKIESISSKIQEDNSSKKEDKSSNSVFDIEGLRAMRNEMLQWSLGEALVSRMTGLPQSNMRVY